jgi:hypothetical protein
MVQLSSSFFPSLLLAIYYVWGLRQSSAFSRHNVQICSTQRPFGSSFHDSSCRFRGNVFVRRSGTSNNDKDAESGDGDSGADLAAEFAKFTVGREDLKALMDDILEDDDEDDEDEGSTTSTKGKSGGQVQKTGEEEEDEEEAVDNIPMSKLNIFRGRDEGKVGKLAGNVTLTNRNLYENLKERVLESPSAFVDLVGGEEAAAEMEETELMRGIYKPPSLKPDSGLTAGEVVELVLQALSHNDEPTDNYGVQVFFAYSSPHSFLKGPDAPTIVEYADFIKTSEYAPMMSHTQVIIDKADYSYDKKKAFYTVRLRDGPAEDRNFTCINFILSKNSDLDDCWLIDSAVARTEGLGRSRRRR